MMQLTVQISVDLIPTGKAEPSPLSPIPSPPHHYFVSTMVVLFFPASKSLAALWLSTKGEIGVIEGVGGVIYLVQIPSLDF